MIMENLEKARSVHLHSPGLPLRKATLFYALRAELLSGLQIPTPQQVHCQPGLFHRRLKRWEPPRTALVQARSQKPHMGEGRGVARTCTPLTTVAHCC